MSFTDVCETSLQVYLNDNEFNFWGNPNSNALIIPEAEISWNGIVNNEKHCRNIEDKNDLNMLIFREKDKNTIELVTADI
jgi:hypothetical protein